VFEMLEEKKKAKENHMKQTETLNFQMDRLRRRLLVLFLTAVKGLRINELLTAVGKHIR
jgi:hypothetical protein